MGLMAKSGVRTATLAGADVITSADFQIQRLNPNGSDRTVQVMPQHRGFAMFFENTGTTVGATLDITDRDDAAVVSINAGEIGLVAGTGSGLVNLPLRRGPAAVNVAAGTSHTGSTDEAVLASYTIAASRLKAGTQVVVKFGARVTANNSTVTLTGRLRLGATTLTGTALIATSAVDTDVDHWFTGEFTFVARAAPGAAVAITGVGSSSLGAVGAQRSQQFLTPTNFATNAALLLELTGDWSAADANAVQAEFWTVDIIG